MTTDGAVSSDSVLVDVFGDNSVLAARYEALLATRGIERGLIGPREAGRVRDRHLLNSAAVASVVPVSANVVDLGSGAGLPGIPLALCRPDLRVTLLEPLDRRVRFLDEVIADLGLSDRVGVVRGRGEQWTGPGFDAVVVRAVASLERLLAWSRPLRSPAGLLVALKGERAESELTTARPLLRRHHDEARILEVSAGPSLPSARVIVVRAVRREARSE